MTWDPVWALAAWGASGLIHIRLSVNLFFRSPSHWYSAKGPTTDRQVEAYLISLCGVAFMLVASVAAVARIAPNAVTGVKAGEIAAAIAVGGLGVVSLRSEGIKQAVGALRTRLGCRGLATAAVVAIGLTAWVVLSQFAAIFRLIEFTLAMASPLACVPVVAAGMLLRDRRRFADFDEKPRAERRHGRPRGSPRVVWMIFDELDQRVAFDERPPDLHLPAIDALFARSVVATEAYPPCRCTEISIPAFLTGRLVDETVVRGPSSVDVFFTGQPQPAELREQVTLLHKLRDRGLNCAVTTWYHPFGRLFGDSVVAAVWGEAPTPENAASGSLWRTVCGFQRSLLETPRFSPFGASVVAQKAIDLHTVSQAAARHFAADPTLDFVLLHWRIPHAPYIYDRATQRLGASTARSAGYIDNLALMDVAFGEVRADMERVGLWDNSVVIFTSDHWWRYADGFDGKKDMRVPFAVHFPRQAEPVNYSRRFNTVVAHDLVLNLIEGTVASTNDLIRWLDANGRDVMPTKV